MKPALTPARAVQLLTQNDPSLIECDLSGNATYTIRQSTFTKEVAMALKSNTHLKKLSLSNLGVTDSSVKFIAEALKENKTLNYLNLSKNKFGSAGLIDLAEAIENNQTLEDIDLLGQSQTFGENALSKVIDMFSYNITLKNISWRLQSRQSFAINKLIVRNNEIERRLATGKSCMDILPESRKAEFVGMGGEAVPLTAVSESGPEDTNNKENVQEQHRESPVSETTPEKTSQAQDTLNYPKSPRDHHPTFQRPKPVPSSQQVAPLPTAQVGKTVAQRIQTTGGGRMLSRYLQAAQGDTKEAETKKVLLPEGAGVSKAASLWHNLDEEKAPDPIPKKSVPERRPGDAPKVSVTWQSKVEKKAREAEVPKSAPEPLKPSGFTGKTAAVFESAAVLDATPVKAPTRPKGNYINKVASVWSAHEHEVKRTAVELPPGTGASRVASMWQQMAEESVATPTKQVSERNSKNLVLKNESLAKDTKSLALNTESPVLNSNTEESQLSPRITQVSPRYSNTVEPDLKDTPISPRYSNTVEPDPKDTPISPRYSNSVEPDLKDTPISPRYSNSVEPDLKDTPISPRYSDSVEPDLQDTPISPRYSNTVEPDLQDTPVSPRYSDTVEPDLQDTPISPRYSDTENLFPNSTMEQIEKTHEGNVEWENGE